MDKKITKEQKEEFFNNHCKFVTIDSETGEEKPINLIYKDGILATDKQREILSNLNKATNNLKERFPERYGDLKDFSGLYDQE